MNFRIDSIQKHPLELINKNNKAKSDDSPSFQNVLTEIQDQQLKISKHAQTRLHERDINFSKDEWALIEKKVQEALQKGVNDSLVLVNEAALIINARNNTVITAMNRSEAKSQIFTNINGTIIMD
ncbi:TIGR02530 family flagellar biosynthesis protein [Metabacillus herbersteinensis]|uniref:TIGR02530 family flagellar biosynthesis protein n=1 Tax=Metabacillus herbersteinensis TaxID=283816 RepID=A0ABV6GDM6_9BACI